MVRVRVESLKSGETVALQGDPFHYVAHVLRLRPGEPLELFDGRGTAHQAEITEVSGTRVLVKVGPPSVRPVGFPIGIVPCLPKADKLDWILQKATELGATCFAPAFSARTAIKLSPDKAAIRLQRWRRIVEEAARQSGRADVPTVLGPQPLGQAVESTLATLGESTLLLVLDEEERTRRLAEPLASPEVRAVALVVGPEGGFERGEVATLEGLRGIRVSLGPRVLRAETAPLAALAVILHVKGELG